MLTTKDITVIKVSISIKKLNLLLSIYFTNKFPNKIPKNMIKIKFYNLVKKIISLKKKLKIEYCKKAKKK